MNDLPHKLLWVTTIIPDISEELSNVKGKGFATQLNAFL